MLLNNYYPKKERGYSCVGEQKRVIRCKKHRARRTPGLPYRPDGNPDDGFVISVFRISSLYDADDGLGRVGTRLQNSKVTKNGAISNTSKLSARVACFTLVYRKDH
jgi:hypothetical protein